MSNEQQPIGLDPKKVETIMHHFLLQSIGPAEREAIVSYALQKMMENRNEFGRSKSILAEVIEKALMNSLYSIVEEAVKSDERFITAIRTEIEKGITASIEALKANDYVWKDTSDYQHRGSASNMITATINSRIRDALRGI